MQNIYDNHSNTQCSSTALCLLLPGILLHPAVSQQAPICCIGICMAVSWPAAPCKDRRHSCHKSLSLMMSGLTSSWAKPCCLGELRTFQWA